MTHKQVMKIVRDLGVMISFNDLTGEYDVGCGRDYRITTDRKEVVKIAKAIAAKAA